MQYKNKKNLFLYCIFDRLLIMRKQTFLSFFKNINPDILKIIALISMTIDHIGHVLFPGKYFFLRVIGRLALPIFSYLFALHLAENNHIYKKYAKRLLPFAFLSLIIVTPFDYYIKNIHKLSILFSFLLYLTIVYLLNLTLSVKKTLLKRFLFFITFVAGSFLSTFVDYGFLGFSFFMILYTYLKTKKWFLLPLCLIAGFSLNIQGIAHYPIWGLIMSTTSLFTTAFCLLQNRNSKIKHKRFLKPWWLFYAYFPIHFFILYVVYILTNI